jgi:hypothetical protein
MMSLVKLHRHADLCCPILMAMVNDFQFWVDRQKFPYQNAVNNQPASKSQWIRTHSDWLKGCGQWISAHMQTG